jgi:hypothetical protein
VDPVQLDGVEPRTLAGPVAGQDAHREAAGLRRCP